MHSQIQRTPTTLREIIRFMSSSQRVRSAASSSLGVTPSGVAKRIASARSCPGRKPVAIISATGTCSIRTSMPEGSIVISVPAACQAARTGSRSATISSSRCR